MLLCYIPYSLELDGRAVSLRAAAAIVLRDKSNGLHVLSNHLYGCDGTGRKCYRVSRQILFP